jgi:uncharacterized ParB-like nuclease family protein
MRISIAAVKLEGMTFYIAHAGTEHVTALEAAAHESQNTSLFVVVVTVLAILALAAIFRHLNKPRGGEKDE